jgi:hypothetical protein
MQPASAFRACDECNSLEVHQQALMSRLVSTTAAFMHLAGRNKLLAYAKLRKECGALRDELEVVRLRIDAHRAKHGTS